MVLYVDHNIQQPPKTSFGVQNRFSFHSFGPWSRREINSSFPPLKFTNKTDPLLYGLTN